MAFDDTLLDDPVRLADADTGGLLRATAMAGAQVRASVELADELGLARRIDVGRPRALVLIGRCGAGKTVAGLVSALLGPDCPIPVVVADLVPSWVGALDVVFAHTDDPGDRDLAATLNRASRYGASVVLSAPADGPVAAAVAGKGVLMAPRVPVGDGQVFARALATALLTVSELDLLNVDMHRVADELDAEAERDHLGHESFVNPAKSLALKLAERTPLLWGLDPVATAVAWHAAHVLAANAGVVCDVADYAQAMTRRVLHREAVAGTTGRDIFADPDDEVSASRVRVVLLAVSTGKQAEALRATAEDMFPASEVLDIADEISADEACRAATLALRFELAGVYLGLAAGTIGGADRFMPMRA